MPQSEEDKTKQSLCQQGRKLVANAVNEAVIIPRDVETCLEKARVNMLLNQMPRPLVQFVIERVRRSYDHRYSQLIRTELPDRSRYLDLIAETMENTQKSMMFQ